MSFISTQGYKGTRDFYPADKAQMNFLFDHMRASSRSFAYQEYDGPILESFDLYAAKTGEEIVNGQLYHFMDRGERKVAIRPEMTPTLARMVAAKLQEIPQPIRWYSIPNLLRYERPQRGRLREFWQWNVDVLGGDKEWSDLEIIQVALDFFQRIGGLEHFRIKINHREFMDHVFSSVLKIQPEKALKLVKLIDARSKMGEDKFQHALEQENLEKTQTQKLLEFFQVKSLQDLKGFEGPGFTQMQALFAKLGALGLGAYCEFDPNVLRGLDYYTGLVFEGFDISPQNNRALFGGGRYDNLIGLFSKNSLSGIGFGLGEVPVANFCETHGLFPKELHLGPDFYVALLNEKDWPVAQKIAGELRIKGHSVCASLKVDGLASHLKIANKLGAAKAILLTESELAANKFLIKNLITGEQELHPLPSR